MMASGQNNSGSINNKISPRKFSEKIALLNKKEAEGNAEFEEIIKEVQATRTHSSTNEASNRAAKRLDRQDSSSRRFAGVTSMMKSTNERWRPEEREELEQVFQSLIKSAGQYDDQLDELNDCQYEQMIGHQQQQSLRSVSVGPQDFSYQHHHNHHSYSSTHHQQQQQDLDMIIPFQEQQQQQISTGVPVIVQATSSSSSGGHFQADLSESPACRARFSSIGSSMYRNLCANNSNSNNFKASAATSAATTCGQQVDSQITSCQMSLKPSPDKSWQKSCSDPTLSVASETLKCDLTNYTDQSSNNYDDSFTVEARMICDPNNNNTATGNYGLNYVSQHQQQYQEAPNTTTTEVPGIKICAIDDNDPTSTLFRPQDPNSSRQIPNLEGSLPDLTNLQFVSSENVACNNFGQLPGAYCGGDSSRGQNFVQPAGSGHCCTDNARVITTHYESVQQQQQPTAAADYAASGWINISESLYAPKVNNMLSVSECGLTSTTCQSSAIEAQQMAPNALGCGLIMRSHSHNSIDNLTRRTYKQHNNTPTSMNHNSNSTSQFGQHQQQQQFVLSNCHYDEHQHQLFLESSQIIDAGGGGLKCKRFHHQSDDEPHHHHQHGSVSPLNSSISNLTSPQSEQNSPGSSNNEYRTDYLPYPTTSNGCGGGGPQQQTMAMTTNHEDDEQQQQQQYIEGSIILSAAQLKQNESETAKLDQQQRSNNILMMEDEMRLLQQQLMFSQQQSPVNQQQQQQQHLSYAQYCSAEEPAEMLSSTATAADTGGSKFHSCSAMLVDDGTSNSSGPGEDHLTTCRACLSDSSSACERPNEHHS